MNKKLLSLAVGAALAATSGIAAAEVNWYGKFNMAIGSADVEGNTTDSALDIMAGGSKLGIRADEDLDNGMNAWIWSEWHMDPADATNQFNNRDTFVGLSGDFGTVAAGNGATAYKKFTAGFDLFGDSAGDHNARHGTGGALFSGIFQPGGTGIGYGTSFDAISFGIGHSTENGTNGATTATTANLVYSADPLTVGIAILSADDMTGATAAQAAAADSAVAVGGKYTMDNMKFSLIYQDASDVSNTTVDSTVIGLGASVGVGDASAVKFQYYTTDYSAQTATLADTSSWAIGFDHSLSDNVGVGVSYGSIDSDINSQDSTAWDAGISVSF